MGPDVACPAYDVSFESLPDVTDIGIAPSGCVSLVLSTALVTIGGMVEVVWTNSVTVEVRGMSGSVSVAGL